MCPWLINCLTLSFTSLIHKTGTIIPTNKTTFPMSQLVKNPPAVNEIQDMCVPSLGQKDPLEEEMANTLQYSCLKNLLNRGAWWVHGVTKHNWATKLTTSPPGWREEIDMCTGCNTVHRNGWTNASHHWYYSETREPSESRLMSSISKTQKTRVVVLIAATTMNISSTLGLTALYYLFIETKKKRKNLTLHNIIISVL